MIRSRIPIVMDALVGLAIASPQPTSAAIIPTTTPLVRPDLTTQMETAVADMTWPPVPGEHDERGMVKQVGELTYGVARPLIDEVLLKGLVERHYRLTGSRQALRLLNDWERYRRRFVKIMPHEYRRVLAEMAVAQKQLEAA